MSQANGNASLKILRFLKDMHSIRAKPIRNFEQYGIYSCYSQDIPKAKNVVLGFKDNESWLKASLGTLPVMPQAEPKIAALFEYGTAINAHLKPKLATAPKGQSSTLESYIKVEKWIQEVWEPWARDYNEMTLNIKFYTSLYMQYQFLAQNPEKYEMVWGFGIFNHVSTKNDKIKYPLFLVPVSLSLDEDQSLSVSQKDAIELDLTPFLGIETINIPKIEEIRKQISENGCDPWNNALMLKLFRELAPLLDLRTRVDSANEREPNILNDWVLFIRPKKSGYESFVDNIIDLSEKGIELSAPFRSLTSSVENLDGAESELYLPLPFNEDQKQILLRSSNSVGLVVQGPPGTGKSHTIANIIAHNVAKGKRVLVVSEREQALQVLADKIPSGIRDLSISLLGDDKASQQKMERSVQVIDSYLSDTQISLEDTKIKELKEKLHSINSDIVVLQNKLENSVGVESKELEGEHWPSYQIGRKHTPSLIGAYLAKTQVEFDRIPDSLDYALPCPLTAEEVESLLLHLHELPYDEALATQADLPDTRMIPNAKELEFIFKQFVDLRKEGSELDPYISDRDLLLNCSAAHLADIKNELEYLEQFFHKIKKTWLEFLIESVQDTLARESWSLFLSNTEKERLELYSFLKQTNPYTILVPKSLPNTIKRDMANIHKKLIKSGKLGIFDKSDKEILKLFSLDGVAPSNAIEVDLCEKFIEIKRKREQLVSKWSERVILLSDAPQLDLRAPEESLGAILADVNLALSFPVRIAELNLKFKEIGLNITATNPADYLIQTRFLMDKIKSKQTSQILRKQIKEYEAYLAEPPASATKSVYWENLHLSLRATDLVGWGTAYERVAFLSKEKNHGKEIVRVISKIEASAPKWAKEIVEGRYQTLDPKLILNYWKWSQLSRWHNEILLLEAPAHLQEKLKIARDSKLNIVSDLVSTLGWRNLKYNFGEKERQALAAYIQAKKKYGKTGGKYKERWQKSMNDSFTQVVGAIPVWIMSASKAIRLLTLGSEPLFDLIIIDEASQLGIESAPLLSLAKKAIIVGDDKQTSPSSIGMLGSDVQKLIDTHLIDIPHAELYYNAGDSLYGLASHYFPEPVMLKEHFRCLPEIIGFSNKHIYEGQIDPIRVDRPYLNWTGLRSVKVMDGFRDENDINLNEARVIVNNIEKITLDPDYNGMTIGVIPMLSTKQSQKIAELLLERIGARTYEERKIKIGEANIFQGDERDIVFLSLVVSKHTVDSASSSRIGAKTKSADRQAINVAASRARNQLWVVHSADFNDFHDDDLRGSLIEYAGRPEYFTPISEDQLSKCDSPFEEAVLKAIWNKGYKRVISQVKVGAERHQYSIDLVVEGSSAKLAVECDGDRWHGPDRWALDAQRQEVLMRAGWIFERIRGGAFYRNPEKALEPLWAKLEDMGIEKGDDWTHYGKSVSLISEEYGNI